MRRAEKQARSATLMTLCIARDQLPYRSRARVTLSHAIRHLLEVWLSESFGHTVQITAITKRGMTITHI